MSLEYTIDTELGIVRVTAEGAPTLVDQAELAERWSQDPDYRPGMPILLDNRLRTAPSDREQVTRVAEQAGKSRLVTKGTRCAVVVSSDAAYGMTRMFASMSEDRPLLTKPFRDISSAEQWLISGDD